ncbi:MAG TPA: DUF4384 domain-containing protein [Bryobacteraceae bacterium]|jgi:hypothetical protein|nr:DUF4384 domain-containing protein [Bryobacteraceae bacterium]
MARSQSLVSALIILGFLQLPATSLARQSEQEPQLNARDAFWSASDLVGKRPGKPSVTAEAKMTERKTSSKTPVEPAAVKTVSVSAPLGLRYSVLKQRTDGTYQEISPDAVFHAGDRIRLSLMSNQQGYLYVVEQGSSGKWIPLYPGGDSQPDSNRLATGKEYIVPGKGAWEFKGDAGQERLFVLLSREPETDLSGMIDSLRDRKDGLDDQQVAHLRSEVQSRDLEFTTGNDESSDSGDKASYVVNKASSKTADPRVVVDVVLSHK